MSGRADLIAIRDAALAARRAMEDAAIAFAHAPVEQKEPALEALGFAAHIYVRRQGMYLKALKQAKRASDAGIDAWVRQQSKEAKR